MKARRLHGLWAWLLLLWCGLCFALVPVPPLQHRVTDLTQTLDAAQRAALEKTLADLEARKGAQVAVLMLPTTQPDTIEQYAIRVMDTWKLGRRGVDDAVLLVIAKDDRRVRIEVGYGLEGALPDAGAKRIISEDITPRFKAGDYYGGIRAGVDRIVRVIEGEPLRAVAAKPPSSGLQKGVAWVALIGAMVLGGVLRKLFGRGPGAAITGAVMGGLVWWLSGLLIIGLISGIGVFFFTLVGDVKGTSGHFGSGGFRGGFGGGGGFSGGGGGGGGGGASGSW